MRTVVVNSRSPADQLVFAGDGPTMLTNTDINNSVFISSSVGLLPSDAATSVYISPQSTLVVNGEVDVFAITAAGQTASVFVVEGGISYFQSGITGSGFQANQYGAFFYVGNPGHGNLIEAITSSNAPGIDAYGNAYTPGGEDLFASGKILIYAATPPALHNLLVALAGSAGSDSPGNNWAPGVTTYGQNGPATGLSMQTNNSHERANGYVATGVQNPGGGTSEFGYTDMESPQWTGANDFVGIAMLGPKFNSPASSQGQLKYVDTASVLHAEVVWGQGGTFISLCNGLYAAQPGTADTTLAQETWHTATNLNGWGGTLQYKKCAENEVLVTGNMTTPATATTIATLPAGYRVASTRYIPVGATANVASGASPCLQMATSGNLTMVGVGAIGTAAQWLINGRFPLDV